MILVGHIQERVAAMDPAAREHLLKYLNGIMMKMTFTDQERTIFFDTLDAFTGKKVLRAGCKDCILQTASAIRMEIKLHLQNKNAIPSPVK